MIQIKHRMPVSFETPPTTTKRTTLPATAVEGEAKVVFEGCSAKADNTKNDDNNYTESLDKIRQTKVVDRCEHGTHTLEEDLKLRGEPIIKSESVKSVNRSLMIQIIITIAFCGLEFATGVICSSIAMLADSYHMAADVMALIVAFTCIKIATRPSTRHGYGWVRAETLGGFFNGIFMCTVCILVIQEAIGRTIHAHMITHPVQVLIIGVIGLIINIIGMFNLSGHGHSHGGGGNHGHSHGFGSHGHSHDEEEEDKKSKKAKKNKKNKDQNGHGHSHDGGHGHSHANGHGHSHDHGEEENACSTSNGNIRSVPEAAHSEALTRLLESEDSDEIVERRLSGVTSQNPIIATVNRQMTPFGTHMASEVLNSTLEIGHTDKKKKQKKVKKSVNIRGVWIHLMSDALGSIIVMISASCVYFCPDWKYTIYLDPGLSMVLAVFMGGTAVCLVKNSAENMLKRTPEGLNIEKVKQDLCRIVGVSKVERLSVWSLTDSRIIAAAHVNFCHPAVFAEASFKIKKYFHDINVHSTTIEPTFEPTCMRTIKVEMKKIIDGPIEREISVVTNIEE